MKKFILLLTALSMFSANVPAETVDTTAVNTNVSEISPRYNCILAVDNDLTISSNKANCYAYTKTPPKYRAKVKVELQQKGTSWTTLKTWIVTDSSKAIVDENYTLTKGCSYRLKTTHYALNTNGSVAEYITQYSSTATY